MLSIKDSLKKILSITFALVILITHLIVLEEPVLASPISFTSQLSEIGGTLLEEAKQLSSSAVKESHKLAETAFEESSKLSISTLEQAKGFSAVTSEELEKSLHFLIRLLSDKRLVSSAQQFSKMSSENFCRAYFDSLQGIDSAKWAAVEKGAETTLAIATAMTSASAAGAGSLAGYAGMASIVSQMGLGSIMTTVAGLMGSNVVGAAATSVVTASVGGPVVMGALLAGGAATAAYGTYELGKFSAEKFHSWADVYCGRNSQGL